MCIIEPKTGRIAVSELPYDPTEIAMICISKPPSGCKKVLNFYVNIEGKLIVEYDTTPVP
jgi:hypothetical protein